MLPLESERERERDHSPSYFANSNLVSWHKYRPIEKFNIVEEFSFLEWRKIQIDGKENSAGMIGEKEIYICEKGMKIYVRRNGRATSVRNGSEAENRPIPEHTIGFCRRQEKERRAGRYLD